MDYLYDNFTFTLNEITVTTRFSSFVHSRESFVPKVETLDISEGNCKVFYRLNSRIEDLEEELRTLRRELDIL